MDQNNNEIINYRKMTLKDIDLIFKWRNEEKIREFSLNQSEISYSEHTKWFNNFLLYSEKNISLIFSLNNKEFGLVRFNNLSDYTLLNYMICTAYQGKKLSYIMLQKAINFILKEWQINKIKAEVLLKNNLSSKILKKMNFIEQTQNHKCITYILNFEKNNEN